ncbi:FAD-binding oxidoreductase [Roseovarius sp. SCSIO 43702]|uniref:NAD(P)/FAD-dependent oxidoreductase n=1 Tax=Roseovarius sp. SCSIO 43702 TaxID=2823043 RepID=UPI001C72C20E|nr:FAD-dependent oxidoreductase [Roseovarius sp. SCSIO 43702]QYX55996.1 FAD-binding oxidoreductase [Roseovarius sp. SCSIO 43702]
MSDAASRAARFREAERDPVWFAALPARPCTALDGDVEADLAIVGGGFTGLWTALDARRRWPEARIVMLEAARCGQAASARNGGFCAPSISHGVGNALARWPDEAATLIRLGRENLDAMEADLERLGIDADFARPGKLTVAARPWQVAGLREMAGSYARFGIECRLLEGRALAERLDSPAYAAGLFEPNYALVHPGKLVAGLRDAALSQGVELFEETAVTALAREGERIRLTTPTGTMRAARVMLATNAAEPLLRGLRRAIVPIFDYTLVTAPLSEAQLARTGWTGGHGIADSGNQFHYSRKTADNRILWGGFDAVYHKGSRRDATLLNRPESYERLAANFDRVFPSLSDVRFEYAWGGIIDTSARTTFFAGTAHGGRVGYAMGFTGQGVSATRFGALTALDLLEGRETERTALRMIRRPVRFPPEPGRSLAIRLAQRDLAREDRTGRRSLFLRAMDRFGIGFDS